MSRTRRNRLVVAAAVLVGATALVRWGNTIARAFESEAPSRSVGRVGAGHLEHGKRLPTSGPNFHSYSYVGALLGRNTVHSVVREIVLAAYDDLAVRMPDVRFVYGETGWPSGGRMRPHRTHQNGLSVDFMVPVRHTGGRPATLPTWPWTRFGYDLEFDARGRHADLVVDFDAVAAHLAALQLAARERGSRIELAIIAPEFERELMTPQRHPLVADVPFMRGRPWVRHDEHYHVDFAPPPHQRRD